MSALPDDIEKACRREGGPSRMMWKNAKMGLFVLVLNGTLLFAAPAQQPRTSCDTTRDHTLYSWRASVFSQSLKSP
jgi:hypothetical protein